MDKTKRQRLKKRLEFKENCLLAAQEAYMALLSGRTQSYTIGNRSLTRLDLSKLKEEITSLEKDVDSLVAQINSGAPRKTVGVILRDY